MKTVLFDLDGTLLDTERIYQEFWQLGAKEAGYDLPPEIFLEFRSLASEFARVKMREYTKDDTGYDRIRDLRKSLMAKEMAKREVPVKEGAAEALALLRENGYHTAVVTASREETANDFLTRAGLRDALDRIVSAHMVEHGKPAPDVYRFACETLDIRPADTFAVEDAPSGVISAADAGCKVIMVPDLTEPDDALNARLTFRADNLMAAARFILGQ